MTVSQLRRLLGNLPPCKVAMEAFGRAHYCARFTKVSTSTGR